MNDWWPIALAAALALPALATALWWGLALAAINRTESALGSAEDGLAGAASAEPVLVVVPAHNEQGVIASLVASLRAQDCPAMRVLLALDRCTDATLPIALETIAGDERFEIAEISHCPRDWAGKVHAIHCALAGRPLADNQLLVFADADTAFDPSCLRACVHVLNERGLDALSLLSTLTYDRAFERRRQAPAAFELLVRYPPRKAASDRRRRPFANGQFLLMRRAAYERIGRHEAFREELLEDLAIARALWREKLRVQVLRAGKMLTCRMYPDLAAFERGWTRIFIEAAKRKPRRLRAWAVGSVVRGCLQPAASLLALAASVLWIAAGPDTHRPLFLLVAGIALLACAVWIAVIHRFSVLGGIGTWWSRLAVVLWWPIGSLELGTLLWRAASNLREGVPTGWANRSYVRPPR